MGRDGQSGRLSTGRPTAPRPLTQRPSPTRLAWGAPRRAAVPSEDDATPVLLSQGGAAVGGRQHSYTSRAGEGEGAGGGGCHQTRCFPVRCRVWFAPAAPSCACCRPGSGRVGYPPRSASCACRDRASTCFVPPPVHPPRLSHHAPSHPSSPRPLPSPPLPVAESAGRRAPRPPICGSDRDGTAAAPAASCEHVPQRAPAGGCPPHPHPPPRVPLA